MCYINIKSHLFFFCLYSHCPIKAIKIHSKMETEKKATEEKRRKKKRLYILLAKWNSFLFLRLFNLLINWTVQLNNSLNIRWWFYCCCSSFLRYLRALDFASKFFVLFYFFRILIQLSRKIVCLCITNDKFYTIFVPSCFVFFVYTLSFFLFFALFLSIPLAFALAYALILFDLFYCPSSSSSSSSIDRENISRCCEFLLLCVLSLSGVCVRSRSNTDFFE